MDTAGLEILAVASIGAIASLVLLAWILLVIAGSGGDDDGGEA